MRAEGIEAFRETLGRMVPFLADSRLDAIKSWDDVHMLRVQVNHMKKWFRPGLLFLGDAAHAMSPIGGVGINLALQDAVAAANLLAEPLLRGNVTSFDLAKVQARRWLPAALTQGIQLAVQARVIRRVLGGRKLHPPTWLERVLRAKPIRRLIAHAIGIGLRPEHWHPVATTAT